MQLSWDLEVLNSKGFVGVQFFWKEWQKVVALFLGLLTGW